MSIKFIAIYSKRLGLPGFSSHQFSTSLETELVAISDFPAESARLYQLLQADVDQQMQQTGFVPPLDYGMVPGTPANGSQLQPAASNGTNGTGYANGSNGANGASAPNGTEANGVAQPATPLDGRWKCSVKQRDLILKLVNEHALDKNNIEALAVERFGHGVRLLNKLEASGLIDELLSTHGHGGNTKQADPAPTRRNGSAYNGRRTAA